MSCVLKGKGIYPQTSQFETKITFERNLKRYFFETVQVTGKILCMGLSHNISLVQDL